MSEGGGGPSGMAKLSRADMFVVGGAGGGVWVKSTRNDWVGRKADMEKLVFLVFSRRENEKPLLG